MAVVRNAPEEQTSCRRVRAGSSDVSTVSWWSDIFTTLISGKGRGRCCGNFFSENQKAISCLDINITIAHVNPSLSRQWKKTDLWSERWALSVYRENMHGGTSSLFLVATVKKKNAFLHMTRGNVTIWSARSFRKKKKKVFPLYDKEVYTACWWMICCPCDPGELILHWHIKISLVERMAFSLCPGRQEWLKGSQNECQSKANGWKQLLIYFMVFVSFSRLFALWILMESIKTINDSSILYFRSYIMR